MNLIEISEQLKDVPDAFLMKEVQAPTGSYPAYLVISELTRRKRMRENATKEAPTTTVAEDLTQPTPEQIQQASQMISQAQNMSQSPQRLNAGLASSPQASQSLAAMDAMRATPPEMQMQTQNMAGGGLVAFEEGGVIRAQNGLPGSTFNVGTPGPASVMFAGQPDPRTQRAYYISKGLPIPAELMTAEEKLKASKPGLDFYYKAQGREAPRLFSDAPLPGSLFETELGGPSVEGTIPPRAQAVRPAASTASPTAETPAAPAAPTARPAAAPFVFPFETEQKDIIKKIIDYKLPTDAQREAARTEGMSQFAREVPFRLGFMEDEIKKRGEQLAGERKSNVNLALMEAGLGMLGSRASTFGGAVGEGGTTGLKAFRQGISDIRRGEDALTQSKIAYGQAQTLYDQGKYSAGDRRMQQFEDNQAKGLALLSTQNAALVQQQTAARERYLTPKLGELYSAQSEYYRNRPTGLDKTIANPDQISKARTLAMMNAPKGASPAQIESLIDQILEQSGLRRVGASGAPAGPVVRGSPNAPLGAQ